MSGKSTSARQVSRAQGTIMTVHDHDVLNGRGVNIAQHPGNERFRSLITTRYDANYCSSLSTGEKKALAKEIIAHIKALDPPGRFLKRSGSSQPKGLSGPWEELTPKEILKKTCQALRDCSRSDRSGYAAAVEMPEDVKQRADERSKSGMSLKAYAAACAARTQVPTQNFDSAAFDEAIKKRGRPAKVTATKTESSSERKPAARNSVKQKEPCLSPPPMDDGWLKRPQDDDEPLPVSTGGRVRSPHATAGAPYMKGNVGAYPPPLPAGIPSAATVQATPTSRQYRAPVPVTNTPMQGASPYHLAPYHAQQQHPMYPMHVPFPAHALQPPPSMPRPSPAFSPHAQLPYARCEEQPMSNGNETTSVHARMAPYSPVIGIVARMMMTRMKNRGQAEEDVLDDSAEPVPMAEWKDQDDGQNDAALQTAADAAAAIINSSSTQHDFPPLLSGDDIPDGSSLNLSELE